MRCDVTEVYDILSDVSILSGWVADRVLMGMVGAV